MKRPWPRRWLIIAIGGILILVFVTKQWTLPLLAQWLDVGGPPQKADAVVLLTGGQNTRPFVAAALVHGGWAPKVLVNTVAARANELSGAVPSQFDIVVKVLEYGGVPRDRIVCLDSTARTTFDEAKGVDKYLAGHPFKKLVIVTEGPHTRRARWIFQRVLAGRPVEIVMVSAPTDEFDNENWWQSEDGFLFIVSEYFKFFYYGLSYGWLGYEIVGGLAVLTLLLVWYWRLRKRGAMRA